MNCDVCGHDAFRSETVSRSFVVNRKVYLVDGIPAEVCERCGAPSFTAEVGERVRCLIHEPHARGRIVPAELLEFHAA